MSEPSRDLIDPFDDCPQLPARELFKRLGFEASSPSTVDDFQLRGRLWELIYALAGRRFYLLSSDHLSDRELYTWLHDNWLDEEVCDIPVEAEWNCRIDVSESSTGKDVTPWLRFYAEEEERERWALDFPEDAMPPHEDPPFDRDRWLPEPPTPPPAVDIDYDSLLDDAQTPDESDPLGLAAVDAEIRGETPDEPLSAASRDELLAITGGEQPEGWQRPIDKLKRSGAPLLPPDELTDETLTAKLWELLHNLACQGYYVLHTDHLSDRELYAALWERGLRDEALLPGRCKTGGWFHDFIGSGNDEHTQTWLRYFASDQERADHARDWPEVPLPPKEKPRHNRDWRLPKGPF